MNLTLCSIIKRGRFGIPLSRGGGLGSHYQEGEVWDPIIKRGRFGIPLSRGGGLGSHYQEGEVWDPIIKMGRFGIPLSRGGFGIPLTSLTSPHFCIIPKTGTRTWISNFICHCLFYV